MYGWQWLFLIEGLPVTLLALAVLKFLPDGPAHASWLTGDEKAVIAARLAGEDAAKDRDLWRALRDPRVIALGLVLFGLSCTLYGVQLWLPQIVQGMGFTNRTTSFVIAVPAVVAIGAMIFWGRSSDRSDDRTWHVILALLLTAAGLIVASVAQSNLLILAALSVAFVGHLAALPVLNSILPSFLQGARRQVVSLSTP